MSLLASQLESPRASRHLTGRQVASGHITGLLVSRIGD